MYKKGKFSNIELLVIEQYVLLKSVTPATLTVSELAATMNRSESSVQKNIDNHIEKTLKELDDNKVTIETTPVAKESHIRNLFARREGIAVMTPAAAEATDNLTHPKTSNRNEAAIFRQAKPDYSQGDRFNGGTRY